MSLNTLKLRTGPALALVLCALPLAGCNMFTRLSEVGQTPSLTPISNPTAQPGYQPVSMPMPAPAAPAYSANSLWRPGARAFFKDQRANQRGDILTVNISIADSARLSNSTSRGRTGDESLGIPNLFGLESKVTKVLPNETDVNSLVSASSSGTSTGTGTINRQETLTLNVAAIVTQVLPNGNLVIEGKQEVRVNFEVRELFVTGIVRPEDISATNAIAFDQIAEARIAYGGRGQITDMQQPRYGQQVLDAILPF
jgi:flagellar L-ring protein precursor FlgH